MILNFVRGMFAASLLCMGLSVQAGEADLILVNGKIVTVDDQFRIEQAVAIKGSRIVAVGKNAEVRKQAAAGAKVIDLKGRTVIPGLIDNHSHWIRAAEHDELRFDGVTTRKQALKMLAERLARAQKKSRSRLYGDAVREYVARHSAERVTETLDRVCAEAGSGGAFTRTTARRTLERSDW